MPNFQAPLYYLVPLLWALLFTRYRFKKTEASLDGVPAVGSTNPILSWVGAFQSLTDSRTILQEGYNKYRGGLFRVPRFDGWTVYVTSPVLVEELRKAPDDVLSFSEATKKQLQINYTLGRNIHENGYHIPIVRSQLTRSLTPLFPDVRDEIVAAFSDVVPKGVESDWVEVPAMESVMQIICRTSNRIFVGLPKCRDPDYIQLNTSFTLDVVAGAAIINMFPDFLKPIAGRLLTNISKSVQRGINHLRPIIEERRRNLNEYGPDYEGKPNDMLSWLMRAADATEGTVENLTRRILTVNFAAIHTSSTSFTQALYNLATRPEYAAPLREEVDAVVAEMGWTKAAMQKMKKLDSFMKESQRLEGLGIAVMGRLALKDFVFSDGTFIPAGTMVSVAAGPMHHDDDVYANANEFDGFRFANIREEEGQGTKHQMVSTTTEYVSFGHGRHACPGRFFAANELKAMMAHVVSLYDIRFPDNVRPVNTYFATACVPDMKAKVLFRKRQA
ncbi:cytochrome P450 [Gloeophyllum trabeum ATCC 11539]|uniref:Cytochrome P450 n=1 Tax=Gloeophyllum trabeum (strain ATCC 11539 / FP-39264 / Madison 617) TaxID=670483 RepID=S7PTA1_GLOTA|nr:cytochrome P450 [Gloeophyllum trabeum ATCC 11539]EPQ50638.1 cytochrome P450 [Gloeophyllum trabeum ATCC 11539]